jgi:hypothetical protein
MEFKRNEPRWLKERWLPTFPEPYYREAAARLWQLSAEIVGL